MKKLRVFSLILCLVLVLNFLNVGVFATEVDDTQPVDQPMNAPSGIDATVSYLSAQTKIENVSAAFLYETTTGTLMYAQNPDLQIYPSSMVKILTALIAFETGNLDDVVTVRQSVLDTVVYDAVTVDLLSDEKMTVKDLIYCMMVGSGNDAAAVLADYVCGSQDVFVTKMNTYAQELGCTNTQFMNVHGLHDPQQYTTVRDMTRIIAEAVKNEQFMECFGTVHYTVAATNTSESRYLSTNNFLMNNDGMEIYYDPSVTGGRTGTANDGTKCLAATAEGNDMQMICVVAGSKSTFAENGNTTVYGSFIEASTLLAAGLDGYKAVQVLYEGQTVDQFRVINGENDVVLMSKSTVLAILPKNVQSTDLDYRYVNYANEIKAPIAVGDKLTNLQIWYGGFCVAQADLYAINAVDYKLIEVTDPKNVVIITVLKYVVIAVLFLLIGIGGCLLALRISFVIRHNKQKKHSNRQRRDRRRSR